MSRKGKGEKIKYEQSSWPSDHLLSFCCSKVTDNCYLHAFVPFMMKLHINGYEDTNSPPLIHPAWIVVITLTELQCVIRL